MRKGIPLLCLCTSLLLGATQASAYSYMTRDIESFCESNNFPLLSEYASNSCSACHDSNQAQNAYDSGNLEYFCPEPIAEGPTCTDADDDGFYAEGIDCGTAADFNDNNASAYPGAEENCTDGIDNDGNGLTDTADPDAVGCPVICTDSDGDGYYEEGQICGTPADFNDDSANAYPGAAEDCTDGIDNDGDGYTDAQDASCVIEPACTDQDNDTYYADGGTCGPMDCNDNDATINPGAEESCSDGIDNNCNGLIDTADQNAVNCPIACTDNDGDGSSTDGGICGAMDCDDSNATVNPAALEICDDGIDNNCNNLTDTADSVCQTNEDDDDDQDEKPWWRKRYKDRDDHHSWKRSRRNSSNDDDDDDDEDESRNSDRDDDSSYRRSVRNKWQSKRRGGDHDDDD